MPFKLCTNSQAVCVMWGNTFGFPINNVSFQLIYSFIFETRCKYFECFKYLYNSLEKVKNDVGVFDLHAKDTSECQKSLSEK